MVKIRLSERFTKETIKRVQKKFTFYAECEFLRPLGQTYLSKSEREYLRNEVSEIRISKRKNKGILIFPSESILEIWPQSTKNERN